MPRTDGGELAAQIADMHVQATVETGVGPVQDALVEKGLAQRLAGVGLQGRQQAVLGTGQPGALAMVRDIMLGRVEVNAQALRGAAGRRSSATRRSRASTRASSSARLKGLGR